VSPAEVAGLCLALVSSACLNLGFFWQHDTVSRLPALSLRRPIVSLRSLFANGRWLLGFVVGLGGWALYVAALRLAPLSLVQAVSAGGIALLALLVERVSHVPLSRREWIGVGVASFGLAALGVSLWGAEGSAGHHGSPAVVLAWVGVSLGVAVVAAGPGSSRLVGGAGFGLAAGTLYAAGDVATKAAVVGGLALLFTAVVLACHGLAFAVLQLGFQRGGALSTAGVSTLATNALPIVAGAVVFGESIPAGAMGAVRLLAFAAVIVGAGLLARADAPARVETGTSSAAWADGVQVR
jgi:hypothetical protein